MANFTVTPQALTFNTATVRGPIAGLYAAAQTMTFVLKNTSGNSVTITNYGFSTSTAGDAVTQPAGILYNSDFVVIPTGGFFPVTVANNATQSFTVTYAPLRRGSGFGDVRSAILALFTGSIALTNGGQVLGLQGEVINSSVPVPVTVGVGGGVIEEAYDNARVAPIYWSAGVQPVGSNGVVNNSQGLNPSMTIADFDTTAHESPMMFWDPNAALPTAAGTNLTTPWTPRAAVAGKTGGYNGATYVQPVAYDYGTPRGGRSYQVIVFFGDDSQQFDLTISAVVNVPSNPTLVSLVTWTGLTYKNVRNLFIGNNEGLDLAGLTLVATTTNFTGAAKGYNVGAVRTA